MDAIIPAAGFALRMKGMPKFLLPSSKHYESLLEIHLNNLKTICDKIWVPTRPEIIQLLDSLGFTDEDIIIFPTITDTMSETVNKVLNVSNSENFILIMPDTFFYGDKPYEVLDPSPEIADVACWKIRSEQKGKLGQVKQNSKYIEDIKDKSKDCDYEYSWGCFTFSRELEKYIVSKDPMLAMLLKMQLKMDKTLHIKILMVNISIVVRLKSTFLFLQN